MSLRGQRGLIAALLSLLAVLILMSCKPPRPETLTWQEEVQLSDGRIVVIERQEHYSFTQEFGGLGEMHTDSSRLTLSPAQNEALPPLTTDAMPLIFDVEPDSGQFFAIAIVDNCYRARDLGLDSRRPYFEYRLVDNSWRRSAVSDGKIGWKTNLLIGRSLVETGAFISLAQKTSTDSNATIDRIYKNVASHVSC